ncbi:Galactokinase [invertebrate metagenome]|uniref:Galactokinase n=1 Tax=invertebrate metagenome TaxID=1711999 RepID=A0A2H9TCR5_9ZZZZ
MAHTLTMAQQDASLLALKQQATHLFEKYFGMLPDFCCQAPGRVNLIGEHTDYNDGFVLPCAIDHCTVIAVSPRNDNKVVAVAANYCEEQTEFSLTLPIPPSSTALWSNYIRGVAQVLLDKRLPVKGVSLVVAGDIPQGAGLSSSASLEVAMALAMTHASGVQLSAVESAQYCQQAENHYVGCQCGIMDQMVSASAIDGHAMLLDCRTLEISQFAIPSDIAVMIINSNVKRGLVDSEYNIRRLQCEEAARICGVKALRDVDDVDSLDFQKNYMSNVVYRRARHVVTENQRTLQAAIALQKGDLSRLGSLMDNSHRSMADDFEITVPPIDALVDIIRPVMGSKGGVRMTGGGFGGCVVALMPRMIVDVVKQAVGDHYYDLSGGLNADIYVCKPSSGASLLD